MPESALAFLGAPASLPHHHFCLVTRVLRRTGQLAQSRDTYHRPPPLHWAVSKEPLVSSTKSAGAWREPGALLTNLWYLSNLLCLSWCHQVSQQCPRALGDKLKAVQRYLVHLCDCWAGEMEV